MATLSFTEKDELAYIHPDDMVGKVIGKSREGRSIFAIEVGSGPRHVLAVASAHADEPTGTVTLVNVAKHLAESGHVLLKECTFHFIPQLNPDETLWNWPWMSKPFSYETYTRFNVRNEDPRDDVEHGIPLDDGPCRPEVQAFCDYASSLPPLSAYVTLHSTYLLGGPFFYLGSDKDLSTLMKHLQTCCEENGLPLQNLSVQGMNRASELAPGFFEVPPSSAGRGTLNTCQYIRQKCGCPLVCVTEFPSVVAPLTNDQSVTTIDKATLEASGFTHYEKYINALQDLRHDLAHFPLPDDPFKKWKNIEMEIEHGPNRLAAWKDALGQGEQSGFARQCDVYIDELQGRAFEYLVALAALHRLEGLDSENAMKLRMDYEGRFKVGWRNYLDDLEITEVPLHLQCTLQAETIVACARFLHGS